MLLASASLSPGAKRPSTNAAYWLPKLAHNVERDQLTRRRLEDDGWGVLVIWECQTQHPMPEKRNRGCNLVQFGVQLPQRLTDMAQMPNKPQMKRFSVSLEVGEYEKLCRIAQMHRPPLSLQYVVRYALQRFFDENKGRQLQLTLD